MWRQSFWHSVGPPNVCDDPVATHPPGSTVVVEPDPLLLDVQSAWALLVHCASVRATYFLRVVSPEQSFQFATSHDTRCGSVWEQWWESPRGTSEAAPTSQCVSFWHLVD